MRDCPFCPPAVESRIVLSDEHCCAIWTEELPEGSAMVVPRTHRTTVFELSEPEWASTRRLLHELRDLVAETYSPDGWNVGWNVDAVGGQAVMHAHCHLVPRYDDEPFAGRGIRSWIKRQENQRGLGDSIRPN